VLVCVNVPVRLIYMTRRKKKEITDKSFKKNGITFDV